MTTNSGLASRFPNVFNFADYTHDEMGGILRAVAIEKGFSLDESLTEDRVTAIVKSKIKAGEAAKGNGRLVRNMVEAAIAKQTNRVFNLGTVTRGTLTTLIEEDFGGDEAMEAGLESVPQVLAKLDNIVGLDGVKVFIKQLMAQLQMRAQRLEAGLPVPADASLHMIFSGNPGTGKTTVARIVAQAFKSLGILRMGHLVECDRAALVAGYAGQTAIKTKQLVETALGGILFVDEAYALVSDDRDTFGKEALDTLMKGTEDYRDDLVVILAGYPDDMNTLLSRNPASSRACHDDRVRGLLGGRADGDRRVDAADGDAGAFRRRASRARHHLWRDGEGRPRERNDAVRNLLERAKRSQARLMELGGSARAELSLLTEEDFHDSLELRTAADNDRHRSSRRARMADLRSLSRCCKLLIAAATTPRRRLRRSRGDSNVCGCAERRGNGACCQTRHPMRYYVMLRCILVALLLMVDGPRV